MPNIVVPVGRIELLPVGAVGRVIIQLEDDNGAAVDPTELVLTITGRDTLNVITDTFGAPGSRIVTSGVGRFYFPLGDAVPNVETDVAHDYVFYWRATVSGVHISGVEAVRVATTRFFWALIGLRNYIDKSVKAVEADAPLGFTDGQLALWLDAGLQMINAAQPTVTWASVDAFPDVHLQTLIEAAAVTGLTAQATFAIDTDLPNFADLGTTFSLDHHPRLLQSVQWIAQRLDLLVPKMKLQYVTSGALHVQMNPNFRIALLANSAPSGALFRNLFPAKL